MILERVLKTAPERLCREELLASRGLSVPDGEGIVLGLFDGDEMVATGTLIEDVLQGVAVDSRREGEGLSAQMVGALIRRAGERNVWRLFLYTKAVEAVFFRSLGFSEVAATADATLLEWGRPDVEDFKAALKEAALRHFPDFFHPAPPASCIVMNANPFTLGHRHLVETAARDGARVFVLIVEEDRSVFSFAIRRRLVAEGCAEWPNVAVLGTGRYCVSQATFPAYFTETSRLAAVQARLDCAVFARHIVPALSIGRRIVGTEPFSPVTAQYNEMMREVLSSRGVEVLEIPRLAREGLPVSASSVRRLIREGRLGELQDLVPPTTWRFLSSPEAGPLLERVRRTSGRH